MFKFLANPEDYRQICALKCSNFAGKQVITTVEKVTTLERAESFKIYNPSFVVVMGASYVEHHFLPVSCKETFGLYNLS
jgi:hypothetical protein